MSVATKEKTANVNAFKGPWGGIGFDISGKSTPMEMMEACGADYTVSKEAEYIKRKGKEIRTGKYSLLRNDNDKILSSVSEEWKVNQNSVAFEFFNDFVTEGDMEMNTAGVLDEGRMVWALAKIKDGFSILNKKDKIDSYLLFSNPHKYGMSTTVMSTPIRVVCENTLQLALSGKSDMMIRVSHRNEFHPEMVKKTLSLNKQKIDQYKEAAEFLASKKASDKASQEYFAKLFPLTSNKKGKENVVSRNANMLMEILETQPGAELGAGTWWANFNAVTYATDHLLSNNVETRLYSAFYGSGRNRKVDALNLATKMAKAA